MSVSAKVITQSTPVPSLSTPDVPFNRSLTLEPGVHLHWALPDSLTRARTLPESGTGAAAFPGIPDYWLVTRLNPLAPTGERTTLGWVVDPRAEGVAPLEGWHPATADEKVNTVAGPLDPANGAGLPGWGLWAGAAFDLRSAAYYPMARGRFGFHDDLAGLPQTGSVSYCVVGWYATPAHDPLHQADDRAALLQRWRWRHHLRSSQFDQLATLVGPVEPPETEAWLPSTISSSDFSAAIQRTGRRQMLHTEALAAQVARLDAAKLAFPTGALPSAPSVVAAVSDYAGPSEIILHGAVLQVPLGAAPPPRPGLSSDAVGLYPTIMQAAASIASAHPGTDTDQTVEALLQGLDDQAGTLAGQVDIPGATHARSFQGTRGKGTLYARLDIYPLETLIAKPAFQLTDLPGTPTQLRSGHWTEIVWPTARSAEVVEIPEPARYAAASDEPSSTEIDSWVSAVNTALSGVVQTNPAVDSRFLRVQDRRHLAQPPKIGRTDGQGSDQAGWWLDVQDETTLGELRRGLTKEAVVALPNATSLFEVPGPRWYRPWSPLIVLTNCGRSYRFGDDGRFEPDGFLKCRVTGDTLSALSVGSVTFRPRPVLGRSGVLLARADSVPEDVRPLVEEVTLLDSDSAPAVSMQTAATRATVDQVRSAIGAILLSDRGELAASVQAALNSVTVTGEMPSPIAITVYADPVDALFADATLSCEASSMEHDWELLEDAVDMSPAAGASSPELMTPFDVRASLTSSVIKVLSGAFFTNRTVNEYGELVPTNTPPPDLSRDTFLDVDILTAPITTFDEYLIQHGRRERTGTLAVTKLDVVDCFGIARSSTGSQVTPPITLEPRLPYWSRLLFRLLSATDLTQESDPTTSPVRGILLPDPIEHCLEVYDGDGRPLGQLESDPPQEHATLGSTIGVRFKPYPWIGKPTDPIGTLITNDTLASFVEDVQAQQTTIGPDQAGRWAESGLTALLRVIDTMRSTHDPALNRHDNTIRLIGDPILLMNAKIELQGTGEPSIDTVAGEPPTIDAGGGLPVLTVRIGEAARPDNSVLGTFTSGQPARFTPPASAAVRYAVRNSMLLYAGLPLIEPITHPFISDQGSIVQVEPGQKVPVTVLTEVRGGIYLTSGALPRKKIDVPVEQLRLTLSNLAPAFRVGPLLTTTRAGNTILPVGAVDLMGHDTVYVGADGVPGKPLPPTAPMSEIPLTRPGLGAGWLRLIPRQPPPPPVIISLDITSGPIAGGTVVNLTGSGFTGATAVNFGANLGTGMSVVSDNQISIKSPAGAAGVVDISVITPAGKGRLPACFTYA
jgi:hypothetical protein